MVTSDEDGLGKLEEAEPAAIVPRGEDDLAALLYTGGTTGRAKGVMLTHANLCFTGNPDAVSAKELIEWSRHRIGGYKYPREVHVVDAVPLTAVGKLDRKALRGRLL